VGNSIDQIIGVASSIGPLAKDLAAGTAERTTIHLPAVLGGFGDRFGRTRVINEAAAVGHEMSISLTIPAGSELTLCARNGRDKIPPASLPTQHDSPAGHHLHLRESSQNRAYGSRAVHAKIIQEFDV
jgi:hypothetical protein